MEKVRENGPTWQKTLLSWKDPLVQVLLPSVPRGGGNNAVIAIHNAERSCVVEGVCFCAVLGDGG